MPVRALILALCCTLPLAACVGGGDGEQPAAAAVSHPAGEGNATTAPPVADPDAPRARMQAGTDSAAGLLVRFCRGDSCRTGGGDAPRPIRIRGDGVVLFAVSERPAAARVDLRRADDEEVVARAALEPGTLMAFVPDVSRGRYDVRLVAEWPERRAVWRFLLQVPPPDRRG